MRSCCWVPAGREVSARNRRREYCCHASVRNGGDRQRRVGGRHVPPLSFVLVWSALRKNVGVVDGIDCGLTEHTAGGEYSASGRINHAIGDLGHRPGSSSVLLVPTITATCYEAPADTLRLCFSAHPQCRLRRPPRELRRNGRES